MPVCRAIWEGRAMLLSIGLVHPDTAFGIRIMVWSGR